MKRGEVNLSIATQLQKLVKQQAEMIGLLGVICNECLSAQTKIDKQEAIFLRNKMYLVTDNACLSIAKNILLNQEYKVCLHCLRCLLFNIRSARGRPGTGLVRR
jgi:hypothetical protein